MRLTVEKLRPETASFGPEGGRRTASIVFDLTDPSMVVAQLDGR